MAKQKTTIGTSDIAAMFHVNKNNFSQSVHLVDGFPEPVRIVGNRRLFSIEAVNAWAEQQDDPKESLLQAYRKYQSFTRYGTSDSIQKFNRACLAFLRGEFDPDYKKQIYGMRMIASKLNKNRQRIRITPAME